MTPAEVLLKAADLLDESGWTQGEYRSREGCYCALGAIMRAAGVEDDAEAMDEMPWPTGSAHEDASVFLALVVADDADADVAEWNDTTGRTQAEVVAALRAAAEQVTA